MLLLVVSALQLAMTQIIAGDNSCHYEWDKYSDPVAVIHAVGTSLSALATLMTVVACMGNYLNNSNAFNARSLVLPVVCWGLGVSVFLDGAFELTTDSVGFRGEP